MNAQGKVKQSGVVNIHGREYQTVAFRVQQFREAHPGFALLTNVLFRDDDCVVVQASIANDTGFVLATGHAEERRASSQINKTSALENAETSAIGRALAALGFGGTEFATANEVENARHQQTNPTTGEAPPAKRVKLPDLKDGVPAPYPFMTHLMTATHEFVRTLNSYADLEEFTEWGKTEEVQLYLKQLKRDLPGWWAGGNGAPEDWVPIEILISQKKRDLEQIAGLKEPA